MNNELLDPLLHLLSIKSVSTQDKYIPEMEKARHFLVDLFHSLGFKTKILKGKKHGAVFASLVTNNSNPTVLIYGHYDVQPAEPLEEWESPPFEPVIKGDYIFARGATDNKAQFMIHVMAIKSSIDKMGSKLPINVKFIIEGEEEIGSPSVQGILQTYAKDLLRANYLLVSDSEMYDRGRPSIDVGLRGLLYTEIELQTAKSDLHSGQFGGIADNPAIILANIITKLKDENGVIQIPGFYDSVIPPTKGQLKDFKALSLKKEKVIKEGKLYKTSGETKYSIPERLWSRPTLDVNGIWGGYQGEGSKTIIPAKAGAKISMRLVPNQDPDKIYKLFLRHIKRLIPKGVKYKIIRHADCLPYKAPTNDPAFALMKESLKVHFQKEPVLTSVGGSIGFVPVSAKILKVPCVLVGFGLPEDQLHAPNEHFSLTNYFKGIETMKYFYSNLISLKQTKSARIQGIDKSKVNTLK